METHDSDQNLNPLEQCTTRRPDFTAGDYV